MSRLLKSSEADFAFGIDIRMVYWSEKATFQWGKGIIFRKSDGDFENSALIWGA